MTITVTGLVRNRVTERPIEGALVEVMNGASVGRGVRTDANGNYRLEGVVRGAARLEASATGFSTDGANLDLLADTTHRFELLPRE